MYNLIYFNTKDITPQYLKLKAEAKMLNSNLVMGSLDTKIS